ncbi:MAG: hypothetical protein K0R97_2781, partial [Oerskovia sp.]|nr:hypothetical protein [Oerskovia sp.]
MSDPIAEDASTGTDAEPYGPRATADPAAASHDPVDPVDPSATTP